MNPPFLSDPLEASLPRRVLQRAKDQFRNDPDIQVIDDTAKVMIDDDGCWVHALVKVDDT